MKSLYRGVAVGLLQCALLLSMTAKYQWDRDRLPRVWARVLPIDPNAPLRGRYLNLSLQVKMDGPPTALYQQPVRLSIQDNELTATADPHGPGTIWGFRGAPDHQTLRGDIVYFLPENAADPSVLKPGEELWAEVSVAPGGLPRPVRLGIKKDGVLRPLDLH